MTHAAEVVWYATGRFYTEGTKLYDVGYFLHLQGIGAPLFTGVMSETTALLTFAAEPFASRSVRNGSLGIGVDLRGSFSLYLRDAPGASFDDPSSFSQGRCIATFERIAIVPTASIGVSQTETLLANVFTAKLVSSTPFELGGATYDLRDIVGFGITQWGTAASESESAGGVPFVGSAVRVG